ncbi:MAG: hypothetical protein MI919_03435, partial [Holophagales bacterium]|nr:hypothetical protein [Holophagales bacterium]
MPRVSVAPRRPFPSLAPRSPALRGPLLAVTLASGVLASGAFRPAAGAITPEAIALRDAGFAALENEKPEEAETAYRQLAELVPDEPLVWGNLAIAHLRQQE